MPIIKDLEKAKNKIKRISSRFSLSNRFKEFKAVEKIINNVRENGDKALIYYTKKFDRVKLQSLKITKKEIADSTKHINNDLITSIKIAIKRIRAFQEKSKPKNLYVQNKDEKISYLYKPLDSVGIYIPSGKSPLISTVLMTAILAKVAGVKRITIFTPPPVHSGILAACKLLDINEVYQIGGAQAIAAAAYGSESIKPVDKIIGPGNIYVTIAKKIVLGDVGIDGLYGPSEISIIADKTANPKYLAMDLLSQLEHGSGLESATLFTNNKEVAKKTEKHLFKFAKILPNKNAVLKSWSNNSAIFLLKNLNKVSELVNLLAPEHLEIITKSPSKFLSKINNAGAVFLGKYSCESIGDYIAGPSHCLPTGGTARFSSGLTVFDFIKKVSVIEFNEKSFKKIAKHVANLADAEKLKAHGDAIRIRNGEFGMGNGE